MFQCPISTVNFFIFRTLLFKTSQCSYIFLFLFLILYGFVLFLHKFILQCCIPLLLYASTHHLILMQTIRLFRCCLWLIYCLVVYTSMPLQVHACTPLRLYASTHLCLDASTHLCLYSSTALRLYALKPLRL